ncbi:hypothetical protein MMC19_007313 [Ptychographa xylographoides]|nr:hypothetical protein [Ptychographa xylographoides]
MSRFYFGGSDSSGSDDENPLPYPKPLARSAFITPEFSATEFLSSLHNRHQTLEDLRAELRTRNQELNKELLDLVNDNYQDFLGLGASLQGGEEKVEEVRVGLLGFKREIDTLKGKVEGRCKDVEELLSTRRAIAKETRSGRRLLEVDSRLTDLEDRLIVGSNEASRGNNGQADDKVALSESDDDSDEDSSGSAIPLSRLRRRAQQYIYILRLVDKIGSNHPFLTKQEERILKVRQTLLLDLSTALRGQNRSNDTGRGGVLKLLGIYGEMGESAEALIALRPHR